MADQCVVRFPAAQSKPAAVGLRDGEIRCLNNQPDNTDGGLIAIASEPVGVASALP
jgi:hypothetical protein